jgi:hypothetical protein
MIEIVCLGYMFRVYVKGYRFYIGGFEMVPEPVYGELGRTKGQPTEWCVLDCFCKCLLWFPSESRGIVSVKMGRGAVPELETRGYANRFISMNSSGVRYKKFHNKIYQTSNQMNRFRKESQYQSQNQPEKLLH